MCDFIVKKKIPWLDKLAVQWERQVGEMKNNKMKKSVGGGR